MKNSLPAPPATGHRGDAQQSRRRWSKGAVQLLPLLFCGLGLAIYMLLLKLQAVAEEAASWLSVCTLGLSILWIGILQVGQGLVLHLGWLLWQPLTFVRTWGVGMLVPLLHGARLCALRLPHPLRWEAGLALLSMSQWAYYSLAALHHEKSKALDLLLRVALQQVATSLLARCLDRLWAVIGQVAQAVKCSGLQPLGCTNPGELDGVTSTFPGPSNPFSQQFREPEPAALSRLSPARVNLCLMAGDEGTSEGGGGCRFMPLSTRLQNKLAAARSPSKQALVQQVKAMCILMVLLYIYAASFFVQILK